MGAEKRPGTALRGRYLAHNPVLNRLLALVDWLLSRGGREQARGTWEGGPPRRVLVALGGHLGDAVIGSSVLPAIRSAWPAAEIGLLVGSWSVPVIAEHPHVGRVHVMDHFKLNRGSGGAGARLVRHLVTRRRALQELRSARYDVAIDLHPYFPNAIPLIWRAGIPVRIGYTSGGFGPLLTHGLTWSDSARHRTAYHAELLRGAGIDVPETGGLPYSLPALPVNAGSPSGMADISGDYLVVHMGAGLTLKEWPLERWRELVGALTRAGHRIVFTGSGASQTLDAERVAEGHGGCRVLCGRVDWAGFVATIARARMVICIDSVAGHVAAATGTPAVVLMSGMNRIEHWVPVGDAVSMVTNPVACAPCFRSRGCEAMTCVRGIPVESVLAAVEARLAETGGGGTTVPVAAGTC